MSDYFNRFMQQTRLKVDREAAERWKYDAAREGDKGVKTQMATARRTATSLEKSIESFTNLRPEQELAIKAAASSMRALASDLQGLAVWAKAYHEFVQAEYKRERIDRLEKIAADRWGQDLVAQDFECKLMREIGSDVGRIAFGKWVLSNNPGLSIDPAYVHDPLPSYGFTTFGPPDRLDAAERIERARSERTRHTSFDKRHLHCSWADYEAYLQFRREVAKTMARVVSAVQN